MKNPMLRVLSGDYIGVKTNDEASLGRKYFDRALEPQTKEVDVTEESEKNLG